MKPLSIDLRQKVIDSHKKGVKIGEIAEKFEVSDSFVRKLIKRHQETGGVEPKPHSGGAAAKLSEEHFEFIKSLKGETPKITLTDLCKKVAEKYQIKVSVPTMCRIVKKLK